MPLVSPMKICDQKLTPGLVLLTFMDIHLTSSYSTLQLLVSLGGQQTLAITDFVLLVFMTTHPFLCRFSIPMPFMQRENGTSTQCFRVLYTS